MTGCSKFVCLKNEVENLAKALLRFFLCWKTDSQGHQRNMLSRSTEDIPISQEGDFYTFSICREKRRVSAVRQWGPIERAEGKRFLKKKNLPRTLFFQHLSPFNRDFYNQLCRQDRLREYFRQMTLIYMWSQIFRATRKALTATGVPGMEEGVCTVPWKVPLVQLIWKILWKGRATTDILYLNLYV